MNSHEVIYLSCSASLTLMFPYFGWKKDVIIISAPTKMLFHLLNLLCFSSTQQATAATPHSASSSLRGNIFYRWHLLRHFLPIFFPFTYTTVHHSPNSQQEAHAPQNTHPTTWLQLIPLYLNQTVPFHSISLPFTPPFSIHVHSI